MITFYNNFFFLKENSKFFEANLIFLIFINYFYLLFYCTEIYFSKHNFIFTVIYQYFYLRNNRYRMIFSYIIYKEQVSIFMI